MTKTLTLPILLCVATGCLFADLGPNLLINSGFDSSGGWSRWWGGNSSLSVDDPVDSDRCAGVWWQDDGIYQNLGSLTAGTYEFGGKLLTSGSLVGQRVIIQASVNDGTGTQYYMVDIVPGDSEGVWHSKYSFFNIPTSASVTITLMLSADAGGSPHGIGMYDDIYLRRMNVDPERNYYGAKLEPHENVMHTAGQNLPDFNAYWNVMDADERPACYMSYCNLSDPFMPALRQDLERYRRDYGIYMPVQLGLYIVGIEDEIAAGLWDADIQRFCNDLNQLGYPLYIRIGYECNGPHNNYDPENYKAAFIRITNALRANNVEAATVFNVIQFAYSAWYPGDAYVDWMSINAFSVWNVQSPVTYTFLDDAHARGKPVLIGEADPTWWHTDQGQASWDGYFVPYFDLIRTWPGIKNFCYINTDWTYSDLPDWGDCRLQPYPIVAQHYRDEMNSALYLHGTSESALREDICGITDTLAPGKVTGFTIDTVNSPAAISWAPAADDTGINRYEILRDGTLAGYSRTQSFTDSGLFAGKTYIYQVTAIDTGGNRGPASDPVKVVTAPSVQKIINGEYNSGRSPWSISYNAAGLSISSTIDTSSKLSGVNSCKLTINQVTGTDWHLQYYQNLNTKAGSTYQVSFKAAADRNTSLKIALQETHAPFSSFIVQTFNLTTSPQTFTFTGTAPDDDNVNLAFFLGAIAPRTIWLDAISIIETSNNPDPQTCPDAVNSGFRLLTDLSGDCYINLHDASIIAQQWLNPNCQSSSNCLGADVELDGEVNTGDLAAFGMEWLDCNNPQDFSCHSNW